MKNNLQVVSRVIVSFALSLVSTFTVLLHWPTTDMGFADLALAFEIPYLTVLISVPLTLFVYSMFLRKIPHSKLFDLVFIVLALVITVFLFFSLTYNSIWLKFNPAEKQRQKNTLITGQLSQYYTFDYKDPILNQKPYHLDEWLTYSDPAGKFSLKYPPIFSYQSDPAIPSKISFFFKEIKPEFSTPVKKGNEVFTVAHTNSPILEKNYQTVVINNNPVIITKYRFYVQENNNSWLEIGYNLNESNNTYQSEFIRNSFAFVILQTLTLK